MKVNAKILLTVIVFVCTFPLYPQNNIPKYQVDGQTSIEERITIESKLLNERRTVLVSLPPNYSGSQNKYPVIYFTDGSFTRLRLFRGIVSFLVNLGKIPDAILVGITHNNRDKELTPNDPEQVDVYNGERYTIENCGGANQLMNFMNKELFPVIESNYRTLPSRLYIGWSYGGLFGLFCAIKNPIMFNGQIAIDPSYWWKSGGYVDSLIAEIKSNPSNPFSLYISMTKSNYIGRYERLKDLSNGKPGNNFKFNYLFLPEQENHQSSPVLTLYYGLPQIFEEYPADNNCSFEEFKIHFSKPVLGAVYQVSESAVNDFGYAKLGRKQYEEAVKAFEYNTTLYPNSANVYDSLGEAYMLAGNKELAIKNYEKSLELYPQNANAVEQLKILKQ